MMEFKELWDGKASMRERFNIPSHYLKRPKIGRDSSAPYAANPLMEHFKFPHRRELVSPSCVLATDTGVKGMEAIGGNDNFGR